MILAKPSVSLLIAAALYAAPAEAGWYMKQTHSGMGSGNRTAELLYDHHKLRVDSAEEPSVVIDLGSGDFTYIDHGKKQYATVSLDTLVTMRNQMVEQMKAQLDKMPPELRGRVEQQLRQLEDASKRDLAVKKTGKSEKIVGHSCQVYTWTGPDGAGEACIANKLPVDLAPFQADALLLGKRLGTKGLGAAATAMPMLQLAKHGFPLRTKRVMEMGPSTFEATSEVTEVRAEKVEASRFEPPKGYTKQDFQKLMQQSGAQL